MFPAPLARPQVPCRNCDTPVFRRNAYWRGGFPYGEDCATRLGITTGKTRLPAWRQTGPDLIDHLRDQLEEEDHCDGWDRD